MMKQLDPRILSLIFVACACWQQPLYAVADLDSSDVQTKTAPPPQKQNQPIPPSQKVDPEPEFIDPSDTQPKDAASQSKEYSYSFTLPLPAGNVLPLIPDGEKFTPPEQIPVQLPPVVPIVKRSLSWRNHALLMFSSKPDRSVIFKSYFRGSSDFITALVNQSADLNYQITTDYLAAGHILIEVPEQVSETRKPITFVIAFRMKDDNNTEMGLKVLPPVSKYSLNLAQNFLSKVENRMQTSTQNTF